MCADNGCALGLPEGMIFGQKQKWPRAYPDLRHLMPQMIPLHRDPAFCQLLIDSYAQLLGLPLVPQAMPVAEATEWLYENAPFAVLAHNTDPDPLFIYGNKAAQQHFEYSLDRITQLPSRLSADAPNLAKSSAIPRTRTAARLRGGLQGRACHQVRPALHD